MSGRSDIGPDTRCLIVIPAFNEETRIGAVLRQIAADLAVDVAVVDDGSSDRTAQVVRTAGAHLIRHPINLGYGAALQTGYKFALRNGYSILAQMDADGQHLASEIPALIAPIERGEADLVLGSRFGDSPSYKMSPLKRVGSELFRLLGRGAGLEVSDPTSGFQAMNRKVMELYSTDFYPTDFPDVDVLLTAHRSGLRLVETPVRMLEGERKSSLHSGLRPIYYVYRTLLAVWVASSVQRH
jgi:glycosyltransferase involved in cell wall biosynthesis